MQLSFLLEMIEELKLRLHSFSSDGPLKQVFGVEVRRLPG